MRYLLTPVGSSGDIHPFIGLGAELRARGHEVLLTGAEPHRQVVERAGIQFLPTFTAEAYQAATEDPDLWHPRRGLAKVMEMAEESLVLTWRWLEEHYQPGRTMLVGHPVSFATRIFEERTGAPAATVHLAPSSIRSAHQVPALPSGVDISAAPLPFKRVLWSVVDHLLIDPRIRPALNRFRARQGLPPVRRVFARWLNSPRAVLGLFPPWFGPRQPDWPAPFHHASFPLWDDPDSHHDDPVTERFLADGPPPVVASPGSANRQAAGFFRAVAGALQRSGRRGLFLTGYPEQLPADLPPTIHHCGYLPFSRVLPRASVFVHHGGVGSIAQGLAAGIPQLIMPMAYDQPDNALRARRLGVARWLAPGRFTTARVSRALDLLQGDAAVSRAADEIRSRLAPVDGIGIAADLVERAAEGEPLRAGDNAG